MTDLGEKLSWLEAMLDLPGTSLWQRSMRMLRRLPESSQDEIIFLLVDRRPEVRSSAARALGVIGAPVSRAIPILRELSFDEAAQVRFAATEAMLSISVCSFSEVQRPAA